MHSFPNVSSQKTRGHHSEKRAGLCLILPNNLLQLLNLKPVPSPSSSFDPVVAATQKWTQGETGFSKENMPIKGLHTCLGSFIESPHPLFRVLIIKIKIAMVAVEIKLGNIFFSQKARVDIAFKAMACREIQTKISTASTKCIMTIIPLSNTCNNNFYEIIWQVQLTSREAVCTPLVCP